MTSWLRGQHPDRLALPGRHNSPSIFTEIFQARGVSFSCGVRGYRSAGSGRFLQCLFRRDPDHHLGEARHTVGRRQLVSVVEGTVTGRPEAGCQENFAAMRSQRPGPMSRRSILRAAFLP